MHELKEKLEIAKAEIEKALKTVNLVELHHRVTQLETLMQEPAFWNDRDKAQATTQESSHLKKYIEDWENISKDCNELLELVGTISAEENPKEADELREMVNKFDLKWKDLSIRSFLNGKYDANNAILSIHAGTGGKDAADFAQMLMRMYLRYAEKKGYETVILDESPGEEAGLKSATILIKGYLVYGYLKSENGVHRLVRLSPFNAKHTRETSFAQVEVLPEIKMEEMPEITKDDLRVDTYRASGAGGQHVNKTDSAVRVTHLPTGLVVSCQNERSQAQNKEYCMKILAAKLNDLIEQENAETIEKLKGGKKEMSWGNQIRSYVLHPYTMVKDHRTKAETPQVYDVLDGDLEIFIRSYLEKNFQAPKANLS